jgi:uncharacterized membrane protein YedE/YeeE
MAEFSPVSALAGGLMIGAAAALFLLLHGRIAGISGIAGGLLRPAAGNVAWRIAFLGGLVLGALVYRGASGMSDAIEITAAWPALVAGGVLVGFGTRLGGGCTSGHGVCGIARLSPRSIVATVLFMAAAAIVVYIARHAVGG